MIDNFFGTKSLADFNFEICNFNRLSGFFDPEIRTGTSEIGKLHADGVIEKVFHILVVKHVQKFIWAQLNQHRYTEVISQSNQMQIGVCRDVIRHNKPIAVQKVEKYFIDDSILLAQNIEEGHFLRNICRRK